MNEHVPLEIPEAVRERVQRVRDRKRVAELKRDLWQQLRHAADFADHSLDHCGAGRWGWLDATMGAFAMAAAAAIEAHAELAAVLKQYEAGHD